MGRSWIGTRILITGASSGIGKAVAELAYQRGASVALVARSLDPLQQLAGKLGNRAVAIPADLTVADERTRIVAEVGNRLGGLDILLNNAGIGSFGHFAESSPEVLRQLMELNFFAPVELTRAALPMLRRGQQPAVVLVASMCGRRALPAWPEYSASKFALVGWAESLRAEMVRFGIRVQLIEPGLTQTGLGTRLLRNEGKMPIDFSHGMTTEYVARRLLRAVETGSNEVVLGRDARLLLALNRAVPRIVDWLMGRKVRQLYAAEIAARRHGQ